MSQRNTYTHHLVADDVTQSSLVAVVSLMFNYLVDRGYMFLYTTFLNGIVVTNRNETEQVILGISATQSFCFSVF